MELPDTPGIIALVKAGNKCSWCDIENMKGHQAIELHGNTRGKSATLPGDNRSDSVRNSSGRNNMYAARRRKLMRSKSTLQIELIRHPVSRGANPHEQPAGYTFGGD